MAIEETEEDIVDVFDEYLQGFKEEMHTVMLGKIQSWDSERKVATVQPLVNLALSNNEQLPYKPIDNVPVLMQKTEMFEIQYNPKKGDGVLILCCENGIGNYLNSQMQVVDSDDQNRFSLTDAIAIPGIYPPRYQLNSKVKLTINDNGSFKLQDNLNNKVESIGTSLYLNDNLEVLQ